MKKLGSRHIWEVGSEPIAVRYYSKWVRTYGYIIISHQTQEENPIHNNIFILPQQEQMNNAALK